jgi:hypothetical protein
MVEFYYKVQDAKPTADLTIDFHFNNNKDIPMENEEGDTVSFEDYMTAIDPYLEEDSEEYQLVFQNTKLWCMKDVFIN